MLEHFSECYFDLSGPILCPVLGSITPLFIPNSSIRPIRLIGLCVSLITFLYPPVPRIQFDPSTANSQFVESLRWLPYENIHLYMGIDGLSLFFVILTTFLIPICISVGWSGMRSFGKEYITAFLIREFLMIAVSCMLCSFRKRANPYVVRSWASSIRWDQAFPLQGPCAVNPLRAVPRRRKVVKVPAKLSGRGVVLCVSIAFLVEPPNHTSFFGGRVLRVVGTS
jgi:NADH-ubiquinone oxidoreductase chain 4